MSEYIPITVMPPVQPGDIVRCGDVDGRVVEAYADDITVWVVGTAVVFKLQANGEYCDEDGTFGALQRRIVRRPRKAKEGA